MIAALTFIELEGIILLRKIKNKFNFNLFLGLADLAPMALQ